MTFSEPQRLSDRELLERVEQLVKKERVELAELLAHLGEVDARKLYLEQACCSMFAYCTERLHFSEWAAYNRIAAARAARRFPIVLEKLSAGELHLSGLTVLAPHLTPQNHLVLLQAARHKSKRAVEALVADLHPEPDVSTVVRRVAAAKPAESPSAPVTIGGSSSGALSPPASPGTPVLSPAAASEGQPATIQTKSSFQSKSPRQSAASVQEPLGNQRYRLHVTLPSTTCEKLREAQALLRHQVPDGDVAEVIDRALALLLREVKKRRFGLAERPGRTRAKKDQIPSSRHIPAQVRRRVFERDGGRCTYIDSHGRRCGARESLEFHHLAPWARGGNHDPERIVLLCRAHNQRAAEVDFGRLFMEASRRGMKRADWPRGQLDTEAAAFG